MEEKQLDLVFIMDATGSMGPWIESAQQNVCDIVTKITASEKADVRFGLVAFRDHPPQERSYITKVFDFTQSLKKIKENVNSLSASGGGDFPEAIATALHDAKYMKYREDAVKICVLIGDAPMHGMGFIGDGFYKGSPDGNDPIEIAREMFRQGITMYTVVCSKTHAPIICFVGLADITGGSCFRTMDSSQLTDIILSGAAEEMDIEEVIRSDAQKVIHGIAEKYADESQEFIAEKIAEELEKLNVQTREVESDAIVKVEDVPGALGFSRAYSLKEARKAYLSVTDREKTIFTNKIRNIHKPMYEEECYGYSGERCLGELDSSSEESSEESMWDGETVTRKLNKPYRGDDLLFELGDDDDDDDCDFSCAIERGEKLDELEVLSKSVHGMSEIGSALKAEIDEQNEMLNSIENSLTTNSLKISKKPKKVKKKKNVKPAMKPMPKRVTNTSGGTQVKAKAKVSVGQAKKMLQRVYIRSIPEMKMKS